MVSCLSCDAEIVAVDVQEGEMVTCDHCGAEHEVLTVAPLELVLLDEDPEEDDDDLSSADDDEDEDEEF